MPRSTARAAALPAILLAGAALAGSGPALSAQPTAGEALRTVDVQPSAPPPPTDTTSSAAAEAPSSDAREDLTQRIVIRPGDTLAGRLAAAGIDAEDAHDAVAAIATHVPPRRLQPGQQLTLRADPADPGSLIALAIAVEPGRTVRARRTRSGAWQAEEDRATARRHLVRIEGGVRGGLFDSLRAAGLPPPLALDLVRALARIIDLQRELQPGDRFVVAFERLRDPDRGGMLLGHGALLHAELDLSGRRIALWNHARSGGDGGDAHWYDEAGRPLRRAFLRTPLDGARLTSGFGPRRHPVLGFTRMHQGIDFAAPAGTPVYAAADGVVVSARTEGGYGRIIRLRHPGGAETRYAHLARFARGLRPGRAVKQGQTIGAVGSSGLATGPHLHYEIALAGGQAIDPAGAQVAAITAEPLTGRELLAFQEARRRLDRQLASLTGRNEVALAAD